MFISSFATRSETVYKCKIYNFAEIQVQMLKPPSNHNPHCGKIPLKQTYTRVGPNCLISCNKAQSKIGSTLKKLKIKMKSLQMVFSYHKANFNAP